MPPEPRSKRGRGSARACNHNRQPNADWMRRPTSVIGGKADIRGSALGMSANDPKRTFHLFCSSAGSESRDIRSILFDFGLAGVNGCLGRRVLRQPGEKELVAEGQDDSAYKEADDFCAEKAADGTHEDDQHGHIDAATQ